MTALDDGSALVKWRSSDGTFLSRVRPDEIGWTTRLEAGNGGRDLMDGISIHGRIVAVTGDVFEDGKLIVEGLSVDDGARLWRRTLPKSEESERFSDPLFARSTNTIDEVITRGTGAELIRLNPDSGKIVARLALEDPVQKPFRFGSGISVQGGSTTVTIDDSHVDRVAARHHEGCAGDGVHDPPKRGDYLEGGCLDYLGQVVQIRRGTETDLRFQDGPSIALGGHLAIDSIALRFPRQSTTAGKGTRFTPFVVYAQRLEHLVVVDLERRRVVSRAPILIENRVFRIGHLWYITDQNHISLLDGDTGTSTRLSIKGVKSPISPTAIADGVLWLASERSHEALVLARVDARTLTPLDVPSPIELRRTAGTLSTQP